MGARKCGVAFSCRAGFLHRSGPAVHPAAPPPAAQPVVQPAFVQSNFWCVPIHPSRSPLADEVATVDRWTTFHFLEFLRRLLFAFQLFAPAARPAAQEATLF